MSTLKKLRRKMGEKYWELVKRFNTWIYFRRRDFRRLADWLRGFFYKKPLDIDCLSKAECIVVCAHPDDETLYFYSVIKKRKPFIICMSNAGSKIRSKEFYSALEVQGVEGVMLNLPDVPHMAWAWRYFAAKSLKKVAKHCTTASVIYTHNNSGESHHPHHYASFRAVAKAFSNCRIITTAAEIPVEGKGLLSQEDIEHKHEILKVCYPTQIKMLETWYPWWKGYLETEFFEE